MADESEHSFLSQAKNCVETVLHNLDELQRNVSVFQSTVYECSTMLRANICQLGRLNSPSQVTIDVRDKMIKMLTSINHLQRPTGPMQSISYTVPLKREGK